ncbi:hypothetical protein [Polynucleobacter sp. MWH-UH2A]|uniref:hypothetical protein n=1 Tax=Polynucleobacter sp. MWH-UH2A TaxID=1855617 RepID=UPI001BFD8712|nr:hypothetical protein [Polynucleobacter sp. MWH-UH2A]QWD64674.1 hypothetical protein IC571_03315 [Polynucleobacter sp. MWH-UH2A]
MSMQNSDFYQAEQYLKLGLYPQAFEAFMALEVGNIDCTFLAPCKMALNGQLNQSQLEVLFHELERELNNKNPQAIYNYGVVKSYLGDLQKATELLQLAMDLGVPEARGALSRLLLK